MPRLSVCVPVYNSEDTVERSLDSILAQSFRDFECIVVDNHSDDTTAERAERYTVDQRLRLVRNESNIGLVGNHNKCLHLARGELLQFVHGDDWLLPDCFSRLVPRFSAGNVGLAFAPRRVESTDAQWHARYAQLHRPLEPLEPVNSGPQIVRRFVAGGAVGNWIGEPTSVMVRRELLVAVGGFRPQLPTLQDIDAWLRILARADAAWVDEELTVRWHHDNSFTAHHDTTRTGSLDHLWLLSGLAHNTDLDAKVRLRALTLWARGTLGIARTTLSFPKEQRTNRFHQLGEHIRAVCTRR